MRLNLTVCDVCQDKDREAKSYKVQSEGRTGTTDRCDEHGAAFEDVVSNVVQGSDAGSGRRRHERYSRTATMEEIEARKAARNSR